MNYNLELAFDFKNSKEYFVRYEPIEITELVKIPEKLQNKKFYVFEKVKPKAKKIGTFLLEFLNLDFTDVWHLNYFLINYFLVNFIARNKNYLYFEYYRNIDLTYEIMDNPKIILTEEEIIKYSKEAKLLYFSFIESAQYVFKNIVDKVYFKTLFEVSTEKDSDYEKLKKLKANETYESILNDIAENFKDIKMNFDLDNFFLNAIPNESKNNIKYYYSSDDFPCLLFVSMKEFMNNKKSFRVIKCKNCDYYFIPKTAHKTLYCDEIFENGKTCKEYVENLAFGKNFANDPVCKRYRNRYKNLQKQASLSNNPKSKELFEAYKIEGKIKIKSYQSGEICGEEMLCWIDNMKIKNKE